MKIIKGVFKWSDSDITAAAIRDDMFEHAGVELLAETFFLPEAIELAKAYNSEAVRFVTRNEYIRLCGSSSYVDFIGDGVAKMQIHGKFDYTFVVRLAESGTRKGGM